MLKHGPIFSPLKSIYLLMVLDPHCWQYISIIPILDHRVPIESVGFIGSFILLPITFHFQASLKSFKRKKKKNPNHLQSVNLFSYNHFSYFSFSSALLTHITCDMMAWPLPPLEANGRSQSLPRLVAYLFSHLPFPIDLLFVSPKRQMDILYTLLSLICLHFLTTNLLCNGQHGILERWPSIEKMTLLHNWIKSTLRDGAN